MRAKTVNFERGQDPKSVLKIGHVRDVEDLREKYDKIQELVHTTPYLDFQHEFVDEVLLIIPDRLYGNHGYGNIHMSFGQLTREELYDFDKLIEKYYKKMGLNESLNFERKKDPKSALDIGIIRSITSDDLSIMGFGWDYHSQIFNENDFIEEYKFPSDTEEEFSREFKKTKAIADRLQGNIIMHYPFFDWKEEDEFNAFLKSNPYPEYPYVYDATPDCDEWRIVFSKIKLPSASEISTES